MKKSLKLIIQKSNCEKKAKKKKKKVQAEAEFSLLFCNSSYADWKFFRQYTVIIIINICDFKKKKNITAKIPNATIKLEHKTSKTTILAETLFTILFNN